MGLLENKTAIVTGSSRGIGAEVAKILAAEVAKMVTADVESGHTEYVGGSDYFDKSSN